MTLLQVHGACFDGATSLEQPELIANERAALSGLGPQQSAMQRQEERTGVGEKAGKWQSGLFAGAKVYGKEFPMHLLKMQLNSDEICQGASDMEDATSSGSDLGSK
ncbi:unnamed protein product [Sphagnum balticum]